jgi:hypothetical protein
MSHVRTKIRNAIKALLVADDDFSGRVYDWPFTPGAAQMPCAVIQIGDEPIQVNTVHPVAEYERNARVLITLYGSSSKNDVAEKLEDLSVALENILGTGDDAPTLNGLLSKPLYLTALQAEPDEQSSKPVAKLTHIYEALYFTQSGNPELTL